MFPYFVKTYVYSCSLFNLLLIIDNNLTIFLDNSFEVFWSKNTIDSFSQNNIIGRDIEIDAIFDCLKKIDLYVDIAGPPHSRDYALFFRHARSKMDVVSCHSL